MREVNFPVPVPGGQLSSGGKIIMNEVQRSLCSAAALL